MNLAGDEHAVRELPVRRDRRRAVTSPVTARPPESAAGVPATARVRVRDRWTAAHRTRRGS
ncbi:MAG TPA: hypothetical protein VNO25_05440 [Streptosporangiaceae bacterium]|nr:hypothetical protein [Streptosporangiaceae bacterium]